MTTAFVFPGQGTQRVGMGRSLYGRYDVARAVFDRASAVLGFDVAATCFRGSPDELRATRVAQPTIFVVNAAALAVARTWGVLPDCVAGHSVGEISALHAAGVLGFEEALRVVRRRAEIMARVTADGAMVSVVGLERAGVLAVCEHARERGPVCIGLHNGPQHYVLSGASAAVGRAVQLCCELGAIKVTRLQTEHAFHSPLMAPAMNEWREFVATVSLAAPDVPVALNTTGELAADTDEIRRALIDQVGSTVRWCECVQTLARLGATRFVEVGDTKVLGALVRAVDRELTTVTMADPRARRRLEGVPAAAGGGGDALS